MWRRGCLHDGHADGKKCGIRMDVGDSSGRRRREARRASTLMSTVLLRQENSAICPSKEIKTTSFRFPTTKFSPLLLCHSYVTSTSRFRFDVAVVVVVAGGVLVKRHGEPGLAPSGEVVRNALATATSSQLERTIARFLYRQYARLYIDNRMLASGRDVKKL